MAKPAKKNQVPLNMTGGSLGVDGAIGNDCRNSACAVSGAGISGPGVDVTNVENRKGSALRVTAVTARGPLRARDPSD